jgi:hypothetical protein
MLSVLLVECLSVFATTVFRCAAFRSELFEGGNAEGRKKR